MEEVRVVDQSLGVEGVVIQDDGPVVTKTTADTPDDEPADPSVGEPAANVEILDGELADDGKAEENAELGTRSVVSPVKVGLVGGAGDHGEITLGEPALEHVHVMKGLLRPLELTLLEEVLRDTEANKFTVLDVVRDLRVHGSTHAVIIGILLSHEKV